jgi:hypothetical protein
VGDDARLAQASEHGMEQPREHQDGGHDTGDDDDAGDEADVLIVRGGALAIAGVRHHIRLLARPMAPSWSSRAPAGRPVYLWKWSCVALCWVEESMLLPFLCIYVLYICT